MTKRVGTCGGVRQVEKAEVTEASDWILQRTPEKEAERGDKAEGTFFSWSFVSHHSLLINRQ